MLKHKLPYITLLLLFISIIIILGLTQQLKRQQWELWQQREYLQQINIERDLQVREMQEALIALSEDLWEIQAWVNTWTIEEFEITFYTKECGFPWDDGNTYTETKATPGRTIAVDPEMIPLGSHVWIDDFGWMVAEDVGGAIKGNIVDIYMGAGPDARKAAMRYGRQNKVIMFVDTS